jgi:hypothetical protein
MKGGALIAHTSFKQYFQHSSPPYLNQSGFDYILSTCDSTKVVNFGAFGLVLKLFKKRGSVWPLQTHLNQDVDHLIVKLMLVSDNPRAKLVFKNIAYDDKNANRTTTQNFQQEVTVQRQLEKWCLERKTIPICASCIYAVRYSSSSNSILKHHVRSIELGQIGVICMQSIEDNTGNCRVADSAPKTLYPFMRRLMFTFLLFGYRHNDPHLRNIFLHGDCAILGDFGMVSKLTPEDHDFVLKHAYESGSDAVKKRWFEILYGLTDNSPEEMNCRDYFYRWTSTDPGEQDEHNKWVRDYQWMRNDSDAMDDQIDVRVAVLPFRDMNEQLKQVGAGTKGRPRALTAEEVEFQNSRHRELRPRAAILKTAEEVDFERSKGRELPPRKAPEVTRTKSYSASETRRLTTEDLKRANKVVRNLAPFDVKADEAARNIDKMFVETTAKNKRAEEERKRIAEAERQKMEAERLEAEAERKRIEAERQRIAELLLATEKRKADKSRDGIIMKKIISI